MKLEHSTSYCSPDKALVSVVVPVYNPPLDRLQSCVDSIYRGTTAAVETVLVDDGSDSAVIDCLHSLSRQYPNVRVLAMRHSGVAAARNAGTRVSSGSFVTYVDSDDEITPGSIDQGLHILQSTHADLVLGFVQSVTGDKDKLSRDCKELNQQYSIIPIDALIRYHLAGRHGDNGIFKSSSNPCVKIGPVARLIKGEVARSVSFPAEVPVSEDTVWNISLLMRCKKAVVVNSCWYWYWNVSGSTVRRYRPESHLEAILALEAVREALGENFLRQYENEYLARCVGEINRVAKNYARPECDIPIGVQYANIKRVYESEIAQHVDMSRVLDSRDVFLLIRTLFARTGLNLPLFHIVERLRH